MDYIKYQIYNVHHFLMFIRFLITFYFIFIYFIFTFYFKTFFKIFYLILHFFCIIKIFIISLISMAN